MNRNFYSKIVIVIVSLCIIHCGTNDKTRHAEAPDKTPKSSEELNRDKASTLPPPDSVYTVIGYANGLKGYIVQYNENLFRGGDILSDSGGALLKKHGIRTIISVTPSDIEKEIVAKHDIAFKEFPYKHSNLPQSKLMHFLDIIKNSESPIYIHCHGGNQRAGSLCAIYRIAVEGWPFEKALIEYGKLGGKIREDYVMLEKCAKILSESAL